MKISIIIVGVCVLVGLALFYSNTTRHNVAKPVVQSKVTSQGLRFLPLGDSYTIGQSVLEADRWPNQLANRLASSSTPLQIVANPAVTGYTTSDLIRTELPLVDKFHPDFVTVLIGVNDYVQGVSSGKFEKNLVHIVEAIQSKLPNPSNLLLVTIPDFGKTPTGAQFGDPAVSAASITVFNGIIGQVARNHNIASADIFPVSQQVLTQPELVASDGLHPSGKQYTLWTDVIYQVMQANNLPRKATFP